MVPVPALPTVQSLGISPPGDINPIKIAGEWLGKFRAATSPSSDNTGVVDIDKVLDLFQPDAFWRDILSLTWDFRTFFGTAQIRTLLQDRLANPSLADRTRLNDLKLETASVEKPWEDIEWIEALFTFSVGTWGGGDGVFRLVFTPEGVWKAYTIYTNLQSLLEYPEKVGALRDPLPNHGRWADERRKESEFEGVEPYVVIVGGGQSGLDLGARLRFLDVPTLIVERNPRVGDQWRNRYQALCLHDPVCKSSFPQTGTRYITVIACRVRPFPVPSVRLRCWLNYILMLTTLSRFPTNWPVWTPAQKVRESTRWIRAHSSIPSKSWPIGSNATPKLWSSTSGPHQLSRPPTRMPQEHGPSA